MSSQSPYQHDAYAPSYMPCAGGYGAPIKTTHDEPVAEDSAKDAQTAEVERQREDA